MRFTKMHGLGNDYVYVNGFEEAVPQDEDALEQLAIDVSNRNFGIGADGLILVLPPQASVEADARMRMFNADGSESQMCGNGIRCVCKLVHDHDISTNNPLKIETLAGVLSLAYQLGDAGMVSTVTVDMGEPELDLPKVPVIESNLDERTQQATHVSMGNPHAVLYVDAIDKPAHLIEGPVLEHHAAYPERMNIHYTQIHSETEVTVFHWERGSGPTLACGTGTCAVGVAGVLTGKTSRNITAHLPGGDLLIEWRESDNHVYMTGPATEVYQGEWPS